MFQCFKASERKAPVLSFTGLFGHAGLATYLVQPGLGTSKLQNYFSCYTCLHTCAETNFDGTELWYSDFSEP